MKWHNDEWSVTNEFGRWSDFYVRRVFHGRGARRLQNRRQVWVADAKSACLDRQDRAKPSVASACTKAGVWTLPLLPCSGREATHSVMPG